MEFQQSKLTAVTLLGKWVCLEPVRRLNTPALPSSLLLYRVKCGIVLIWQLDQFGGLERPLHYLHLPYMLLGTLARLNWSMCVCTYMLQCPDRTA